MPRFALLLSSLAVALAAVTPIPLAHASLYGPDYDVCSAVDVATTGPFTVVRDFVDLADEHIKLTVAYDGYLRDTYPDDQISLYVRLNGHDALIAAQAGQHDDAYVLLNSGIRGCRWCEPGSPNNAAECVAASYPVGAAGIWHCQQPDASEQHLFFWAFDPEGGLNAWDLELAAEAGGEWDSDYGANFDLRLEPRGCT